MFTGIVEAMGQVVRLLRRGGGARLEVRTPFTSELQVGDSVALNGACVTVTEILGDVLACDLVPETVARTNLGILQVGEEVNLERPMRVGDRFGGHIVQGHVDAVGLVRSKRKVGAQEMLEITVPFELTKYLAPQGSVTLDGVSLTVVSVDRDRFKVALIPHTVATTTLGRKGQGGSVNVEVDVLSKYVERHLNIRTSRVPSWAAVDEPVRERPERSGEVRRREAAAPKASKPSGAQPKPAAGRAVPNPAKAGSRSAASPPKPIGNKQQKAGPRSGGKQDRGR